MSTASVRDITDIKRLRRDSADKTLPNGSAKTNGCVTRNGGAGNMVSVSPQSCVRPPHGGLCGRSTSAVVDCRYPQEPNTTLPQVRVPLTA